ncbi:MAG TPA: serine/threonine-protein kinase [Kofleriaceae bacterium]|nr:serine/threonine-protein kinase [Kofleriaceae bacterium]
MADGDSKREVHETLLPTLTLSLLGGHSDAALAVPEVSPEEVSADQSLDEPFEDLAGDSASFPSEGVTANSPIAGFIEGTGGTPVIDGERRGARRGDIIGHRYIVEGQIGRGGMGRVLRVRHQALGKPFALKLIKAPIATQARMREMFYREARLASAMSHDNVCTIVDFGDDPVFGLFMVMEMLEGRTLHHKLRHDGRFAPKVACDVMWQIGEALRYIHSRAIVHGDIKSENILLTRSPDRRRVVKLLDFGLARPDVGIRTERIEGTPEYLAPERIRDGAPASVASDIYALGILFYELLVGDLPFRGTVEEVFRQHVEERVPKPSERIDDPTFDVRADEIIARATARDPAERHPDAPAFLYELRTLMNMLGMETGRRRPVASDSATSKRFSAPDNRERGGAEVFLQAPVPLAAVDKAGNVRVANDAFLEFLGVAGEAAGINLADSGLTEVYPALVDDLAACLDKRRQVKRILYLNEGGGHVVQVAVVLTPAGTAATVTAGEIHLALHPLARLSGE